MPDAGGALWLAIILGASGASHARGHEVGAGIQGAGGGQRAPLIELAWAIGPAGGHDDDLRTRLRQGDEVAREADVVAGGQTDLHAVELEGHATVAGAHGGGFLVAEGIEAVDLVVAREDSRPGDQQGVVHAAELLDATAIARALGGQLAIGQPEN